MSAPAVSVIIPIYKASRTLGQTLDALGSQVGPGVEVLAVDSSGVSHSSALERAYPWLRVVALPERSLPGRARNIGAQKARGSHILFLDADAIPEPTWLARMVGYAADGEYAVAGAVCNGTPGSRLGTTQYLLEFSEWTPGRRGVPFHGASCNLLVRRSAFESAGGFKGDVWPGEDTILTASWGRQNRLKFAEDARIWHLNRTGLRDLLRHQYRLGKAFVAVCDHADYPYGHFSRWPLLAVAPVLRLGTLAFRVPADRRWEFATLGPQLILGLAAWTVGVRAARREEDQRPYSDGGA